MLCHHPPQKVARRLMLLLALTSCSRTETNHETAPAQRYGQPREHAPTTGPLDTPVNPQYPTDGTHIGNGGDLLICQVGDSTTYQILDEYEEARRQQVAAADRMQPINAEMEAAEQPVDPIDGFINALAVIDPLRANLYRKWANDFYREAAFLPNTRLAEVEDSAHIGHENNCFLRQLVVQVDPLSVKDRRYYVDKDFWDKLQPQQHAIIILHEIIYREALTFGIMKSPGVRLFNADIFSKRVAAWDRATYWQSLQKIGFKTASYGGLWLDITQSEITDGKLRVKLTEPQRFNVFGSDVTLRCQVQFDLNGRVIGGKIDEGQIHFNIGGRDITAESSKHLSGCDDKVEPLDFLYEQAEGRLRVFSEKSEVALQTDTYKMTVSGFMQFVDNQVISGQLKSGSVKMFDNTCMLLANRDVVLDPNSPIGLSRFSLQPCDVKFGDMSVLWIAGDSEWRWRDSSFFTHLNNDQVVNLNGTDVMLSAGLGRSTSNACNLDDGSVIFSLTADSARLARFNLGGRSLELGTCLSTPQMLNPGDRIHLSKRGTGCVVAAERLVNGKIETFRYDQPGQEGPSPSASTDIGTYGDGSNTGENTNDPAHGGGRPKPGWAF